MATSAPGRPMPAILFFVSNLAAGGLHYVYQVVASRTLDKVAFADFSFWLANVSVGLVVASLAQYGGNFLPVSNRRLKFLTAALGGCAAILSLLPWRGGQISVGEIAALTLVFATIHGWMLGQAQNRLMFYTLSAATFLVVLLKLGLVFASFWPGAVEDRFYWALAFSYVPSIVCVGVILAVTPRPPSSPVTAGTLVGPLISPVILAFAASAIPQIDLIVVNATQEAAVFQNFARASLFYKGVFFLFLILAHWLLPHQLRRSAWVLRTLDDRLLFLSGMVVAVAMALLTPAVSSLVMHWSDTPPIQMVFLSCWNMFLLSRVFLRVQEACAHNRPRRAGALLAGVLAIYAAVWILAPPLTVYFTVTIAASLTMIYLARMRASMLCGFSRTG